jgi:Tol biopolymer transport system component
MALTCGARLGPYEIQSPLGAGGMGEVYRARDTRLDRTVAIKILPTHLSDNPEAKQRFDREARTISSLNHPNICTLYDVGHQDGIDYLVMEFLEGETLADRLVKGPLPPEHVLRYGIEICEGLEKAHRGGVTHRDLKPGNVMLTKSGAKLMDFGLAKSTIAAVGAGLSPASLATMSQPLTAEGTLLGTFQYMSPEQVEGKDADARSDIFALGAVLYEMITGKRAFEGKTAASTIAAILATEPPPVSAIQPMSPPALDRTVRACLAKDPEERLQTAHDVKLQLNWITEGGAQAGVGAPTYRGSRLSWLIAGIASLTALLLAAVYLHLALRPGPVLRSFILPPAGTSFVTKLALSGPPVISPDGTRLAFSARDEKGVLLYVRPLASVTAQPLSGTEDATFPFWSPDGREIGFFAGGKLKKIDAGGGPPQILCDASVGRGGSWSREGVIVFAAGGWEPLLRVSAAGGATEPATKLDVSRAENSHRWPNFLPDGKHFLFLARSSRGMQENGVYVGSLGSLDAKLLMTGESTAIYVPDYLLFMRNQTLLAQPFNPRRLETTGAPVAVAEHVAYTAGTNRPIFSASDNGTLVYQTGSAQGGWRLLWFGRDGKPMGSVADYDRYLDPALSPDGTRLAVALYSDQGTSDVWIFDLLRGTRTRLTFGSSRQMHPVWAPDGRTIFYNSNSSGYFHIYAKAANGSGSELAILETIDAAEYVECVSSDQRYLVYIRAANARGTGLDIWALPLFGDRKPFPIVQTAFNDMEPRVSPDGKWITYQNNESGRDEIYITAFPSGGVKWQVSNNGGVVPRWRRDGNELFFMDHADNVMAVDVTSSGNTIRLGAPHALFHASAAQTSVGPYDVTADSKKFLVNSGDVQEERQPLTLVQNWTAELKK